MPIRIDFTHCHGVGFYVVAPRSKADLPENAHKLPRWVVTKPEGVLWHRLPEAQAAHWETAACKLTGLSAHDLSDVGIEICDKASGRVLSLPELRLVPALSA